MEQKELISELKELKQQMIDLKMENSEKISQLTQKLQY